MEYVNEKSIKVGEIKQLTDTQVQQKNIKDKDKNSLF